MVKLKRRENMRLFKLLFTRGGIVAIAIILQFAFFIFGIVYLSRKDLLLMLFISYVIAILVVISILMKNIEPTYKIPWIFVVIIFPVLGVIIYFSFGKIRVKKLYLYRYSDVQKALADILDEHARNNIKKIDEDYQGQSKYIYNVSHMPVFQSTRSKYFKVGEEMFESYIDDLKKAKKFIFIEYFIIKEGVIWDKILAILQKKVSEGVEVRVMYDDVGSLWTLPTGYDKKLRKMGIKCIRFNKFMPTISVLHNNRDHRKITVIDGQIGYTGGINLSDEYMNKTIRFGHWKDNAIRLEGEAVNSLTNMFLTSWNVVEPTDTNILSYLIAKKVPSDGGSYQPFGDGPNPMYPEKIAETVYLHMIQQAKRYIYITTPYLIINNTIIDSLKAAAFRGVDVRIITPHVPDKKLVFMLTRANYDVLLEAGVKIFEYTPGFIHAKTFLVDDEIAVVGTINLDYRSLIHHFECGVWMYRSSIIKDIKEDLQHTMSVSQEIFLDTFKKKSKLRRAILNFLSVFSPML